MYDGILRTHHSMIFHKFWMMFQCHEFRACTQTQQLKNLRMDCDFITRAELNASLGFWQSWFVRVFLDSMCQIAWWGFYGSYKDSEYARCPCSILVAEWLRLMPVWQGGHVFLYLLEVWHSGNNETGSDLHWLGSNMKKYPKKPWRSCAP